MMRHLVICWFPNKWGPFQGQQHYVTKVDHFCWNQTAKVMYGCRYCSPLLRRGRAPTYRLKPGSAAFFLRWSQLDLILGSDFHLAECSRAAVLQFDRQGSGGYGFILSAGPRKETPPHTSGSNTFLKTWSKSVPHVSLLFSVHKSVRKHKSPSFTFSAAPLLFPEPVYDVTEGTDKPPRLVTTPPARCWLHLWTLGTETHKLHRMNAVTICMKGH